MAGDPIEGQILLLTAAKASVTSTRLPDLVDLAQAELGPRLDDYRRQYECVVETAIEGSSTADPGTAIRTHNPGTANRTDDPGTANRTDDPGTAGGDRPVYGFLVEPGHWAGLGDGLDLDIDDREADALRRAHEEQLRRIGRRRGRSEELEAALEIREAVLIAGPASGRS